MDQRLRGNAADVEAGSAEPVGFDQDRVEAELAGADRGDIAAWAAADDENLAAKLVHVVAPKPGCYHAPRKRGLRRRFPESIAAALALLDARVRGHDTDSSSQSSMNSVAGASISARRRWMKVAAS